MTRRSSNKSGERPEGAPSEDVVLMCGASSDGRGMDVLRKRGDCLQAGVVRPLEEGKPLHGEVVQLSQRGNTPLFDVDVHYDGRAESAEHAPETRPAVSTPAKLSSGTRGHPPKVTSDDYRRNWDAIWKRPSGKALLN